MKKTAYIFLIVGYLSSLILTIITFSGQFLLMAILAIPLWIFTYIAYAKKYSLIYLVRALLTIVVVVNCSRAVTYILAELDSLWGINYLNCAINVVVALLSIALLVSTFFEKEEIILSTELSREEYDNLLNTQKRDNKKKIILSICSVTVFPMAIVLVCSLIFFLFIGILFGFGKSEAASDYIERNNFPTISATEDQNNAITKELYSDNDLGYIEYDHFVDGWCLDNPHKHITGMLSISDSESAYWVLDNNLDTIFKVYDCDFGSGMADTSIFVSEDYKLPQVETAKIRNISFGYVNSDDLIERENTIELTTEEMNEIRRIIFYELDGLSQIAELSEEEQTKYRNSGEIIFRFEDNDTFCYATNYRLIKLSDGTCGILTSSFNYYYPLPGELSKKLLPLFENE